MYNKYLNEVVSVMSISGEIVGRLKEVTDNYIKLSDPRLFVFGEQGTGFAQGISLTTQMNPTEAVLQMSGILTLLPSNPEVAEGWQQHTSGIILGN